MRYLSSAGMPTITWTCLIMVLSTAIAKEICITPGCLQLAELFQKSMDLTVDPCDDFYRFTCGNFLRDVPVPGPEAEFGVSEIVDKRIRRQLKTELEAETLHGQPPSFQKAKDFYYSCIDTETIERYSLSRMQARLSAYGGWPVLETDWDGTNFNWVNTMKTFILAGQYSDQIVSVYVDLSSEDASKRIITIDAGYHELDPRWFRAGLGSKILQTYCEVLGNISVAFGAEQERAKQDMLEVVEFEAALVNLTTCDEEVSQVPTIFTIAELQKVWPYIHWLDFIRTFIGYDLNINILEPVAVKNAKYFEGLGSLLNKTSERLLANYIMTQVVFSSRDNLNEQILNISQPLYKVLYGITDRYPRWEFCVEKLIYTLQTNVGATYIRKYFSPSRKHKAEEIAVVFKEQFAHIIEHADWLDDTTKAQAVKKVEDIRLNIGYPEELLDDNILDRFYENLRISRRDLIDNTLAIWKWSTKRNHRKLRHPVDPTAWNEQTLIDILIADSQYDVRRNAIDVFAGILQQNFFSKDRPLFLNFGTLSSVIGLELAQSLDTKGKQYDGFGNLKNWWTNCSDEAFQKKVQALKDEYSTYVAKEVNLTLNGEAIIDTVIADQGGYKIARQALDCIEGDQEISLPGMEDYTTQQLFWISAASAWCTKEKDEFLRTLILYDVFPPVEFRVNGPLRQSYEFSSDWCCPSGSYMNPENKFNIW